MTGNLGFIRLALVALACLVVLPARRVPRQAAAARQTARTGG